jgi:hypothetical protein
MILRIEQMPADRGLLRGKQRGRGEQGKGNKSAEKHLRRLLKGLNIRMRLQVSWFPGLGVGAPAGSAWTNRLVWICLETIVANVARVCK